MKKLMPYGIIIGIVLIFFYKTIFFGNIPFPGDLLLSTYAPWRHVSYFGYVAGSTPSKGQYFDVIRELYPWKTEVLRQLNEKTIPLWNPYSFSGAPLLANYQSQVLYPLGILYFLMPEIYAWTLLIILQPILGGIFMYLFASIIGISTAGAILTAVAFNFSSFASTWMEFNTVWHTILWLPLLLFIVEKGIQNKKLGIGLQCLFIFALFSSLTGGHPQDFINAFLFFLLYVLARIVSLKIWTFKEKFALAANYALLTIISFLLAAPQLLPTIELFQNSARVPHNYKLILTTMLLQPWHVGLIAIQDFFGNPATKSFFLSSSYTGKVLSIGTVGFFLSLFSVRLWRKSWYVTFFIIMAVVILAYTIHSPLTEILYRYPLPLLSTGTPTRILFLFSFALSILAGFGFDELMKAKKILWKPLAVMGAILLFLWIFVIIRPILPDISYTPISITTMRKAMLFSSGLVGLSVMCIAFGLRKKIIFHGFVVLVCLELLYGFLKFNPFVPKKFVFPDNPLLTYFQNIGGIDRIWGYGTAQIEADFSTQYRLFSTDGTDPLNLKWYNEFIQASRDGNIANTFDRTTRSDAQIVPGYGARDLPDNLFRKKIMNSLGVKYIIDRLENPKDDTTFPEDHYKNIWRENDWTIYENMDSAPRYFLTATYLTYTDKLDFEKQFFSDGFDPKTMVLLTKDDASGLPILTQGSGSVLLISYKPNTVIFETKTETQQLLYLSDTYDNGWNVTIDGASTPLLKANYTFRAVVVPEGSHTVVFSYKPVSFIWGSQLALVGAGLFIIYFLWQHKSFKKHKNS